MLCDDVELARDRCRARPTTSAACRPASICGRGHCRSRPRRRCRPSATARCACSDGTARRSCTARACRERRCVSSTLPSSVHLRTVWSPSSVQYRSCRPASMCRPCARVEQALAPGAQEIAVAVEHHHRVLAAIEDVDLVLAVDADRGDVLERPAVGQLRPVLDHAVAILAISDDGSHRRLPVLFEPDVIGGADCRQPVRASIERP